MTERSAQVRLRIAEAGQPPTSTYSHWLMPTNAVNSKNQGETSAASSALMSVTLPASANSTRSSGQDGDGVYGDMAGQPPLRSESSSEIWRCRPPHTSSQREKIASSAIE